MRLSNEGIPSLNADVLARLFFNMKPPVDCDQIHDFDPAILTNDNYVVRFMKDPAPVIIRLSDALYTTVHITECGSRCLQRCRHSNIRNGIRIKLTLLENRTCPQTTNTL